MCEPTTIMAGLAIGQMAMQGISGYTQARGQRMAGDAAAAQGETNARLAEQQAHDAEIRGAREQTTSAMKTRALRGQQQVAFAANGIDAGVGSAQDLFGDTALMGAMDRQAIALNAAREAWGYRAQASNYRQQGKLDKWQSRVNSRTTILGTVGNMLGTAAGGYASGAFGGGSSAAASSGGSFATGMGSGMSSAIRGGF